LYRKVNVIGVENEESERKNWDKDVFWSWLFNVYRINSEKLGQIRKKTWKTSTCRWHLKRKSYHEPQKFHNYMKNFENFLVITFACFIMWVTKRCATETEAEEIGYNFYRKICRRLWKINHLEIIFLYTGVCIHCNPEELVNSWNFSL
jgi:hypothetical protein